MSSKINYSLLDYEKIPIEKVDDDMITGMPKEKTKFLLRNMLKQHLELVDENSKQAEVYETLAGEVDDFKDKIKELNEEITRCKTSGIDSEVEKYKTEAANLTLEIENANKEIDNLKAEIDDRKEEFRKLEEAFNLLQVEKEDLENEKDEIIATIQAFNDEDVLGDLTASTPHDMVKELIKYTESIPQYEINDVLYEIDAFRKFAKEEFDKLNNAVLNTVKESKSPEIVPDFPSKSPEKVPEGPPTSPEKVPGKEEMIPLPTTPLPLSEEEEKQLKRYQKFLELNLKGDYAKRIVKDSFMSNELKNPTFLQVVPKEIEDALKDKDFDKLIDLINKECVELMSRIIV